MLEHIKSTQRLKSTIKDILQQEILLCDMFGTLVEMGQMDETTLNEFRQKSGKSDLYQGEIIKLSEEEIMNSPYLRNIKVPNVSLNNFSLSNGRHIYAGTLAKYGYKKRDLTTMEQRNSYFICDNNLRFPGLIENNSHTCWMSAEPFEFYSFEPLIKEAYGNVLLIGCGIGYAAYMLSRKDDVKSITIIDSSRDVLDLFINYLLPQFKNQEKIRVINDDGIDFLKENNLNSFDYINVDIWYDVYDMIYPYLECLEIEKANPNVHFSYWLEEELKENIQRNILGAISDFQIIDMLASRIGKNVVEILKPHTYGEIYDLVNIKNIREFLYSWYINHKDIVNNYKIKDMKTIADCQKQTNDLASESGGYMKTLGSYKKL